MAAETACEASNLVDVLRHYGPIPKNDSMYDERVQNMHKLKKVSSFAFPIDHLEVLVQNFQSESPASVILTGTAGDGKTYYCRQIWQSLGGSEALWDSGDKVRRLTLSHQEVVVVKDLSELDDFQKAEVLANLCRSLQEEQSKKVYLIAANDGQLIEALTASAENDEQKLLKERVEGLLVDGRSEMAGLNLKLFNLSKLRTSEMYPEVLNQVLNHPDWNGCTNCAFGPKLDQPASCPISENRRRLLENGGLNVTQSRILDLLRLCDLDGVHLPIRQQLLLTANVILGHPSAQDGLLKCKEVPNIVNTNQVALGSLYSNVFGENLSERKREIINVFSTLARFGLGNESSNKIDNMLIFGSDDETLKSLFSRLVRNDTIYGANELYLERQQAYLEAQNSDDRSEFITLLRRQRQRLFFTVPDSLKDELGLWELTLYYHAGEYLRSVDGPLEDKQAVPKGVVSKLVKGLNRIFTGVMAANQGELWLATSGHYSQARVCRVYEADISVAPYRGESVSIRMNKRNMPSLMVSVSSSTEVPPSELELSLTRFEYLCRVANGALPSSFSQECYEDILAFKTSVLKRINRRRELEKAEEQEDAQYMSLKLLEINDEGKVSTRTLEVTL